METNTGEQDGIDSAVRVDILEMNIGMLENVEASPRLTQKEFRAIWAYKTP